MNRRQMIRMMGLGGLGFLLGCARQGPEAGKSIAKAAAPRPPRAGEATTAPRPLPDDPADEEPDPEPPAEVETEPDAETEAEDPDPPGVRVEVICRDALGLTAAVGTGPAHRLERVTLHHTAVELGANHHAPARLRGHQRYHLEQGWPDIAYHYAVDLRGNVYELRDPDQAGDTFTDYDPAGHLLVVCEGNYDLEQPSDLMLDGVAALLAASTDLHGVDPATLTGHRDHASGVACPGDALQARLPELRRAAAAKRAEGAARLERLCGETARERVAGIEAGEHEEANA